MSKVIKAVIGLVVLYVVLMGGSGLVIQSMLSGGVGERLREKAQAALPVDVSIQGGDFDLKEWFFFRPAISFDRLRVANPPGYSEEPLLEAERVAARADLSSLLSNEVSIQRIEILSPRLLVESGADGKTNVQTLMDALSRRKTEPEAPAAEQGEAMGLSVDSFELIDGRIRYTTAGEEPLVVQNIHVEIADFDPEAPIRLEAALDIFEASALHLTFDGETGPFTPKTSPTNGKLTIEGFPQKLPEEFRSAYLGNFLLAPGEGSRFEIVADLSGDLLGVLTGKGNLKFENLELGKPDEPRLPLNGEAPILLTLMNPLADPSYHVIMPDAELSLGDGIWQGGVEVQYDHGSIQGKSTGSVTGVDVNQMLTAFSDAKDVAFGRMELSRYDVAFSGKTADEIQRTLQGSGRIDLRDGRLAIFDVLATIEKYVTLAWTGEQQATGVTSFVQFGTDFSIADQKITTPNLLLENEAAKIAGEGAVSFAEDLGLDYELSSLITGLLAQKLGGALTPDGVAQLAVPLRVKGDAGAPRVFVDVKTLAKDQAIDQAQNLLDKLLSKGKDKDAEGEGAEGEQAAPQKPRLPFDLESLFKKR